MNHTTVGSKGKGKRKTTIAGGAMIVTERELEIPPQKMVYEEVPTYIAEKGDMQIPVGSAVINENNEFKKADGTVIMVDPKVYLTIKKYQKQRNEMKDKMKAMKKKETKKSTKADKEYGE